MDGRDRHRRIAVLPPAKTVEEMAMNSGLEFFTTQELISELMRRKTFLGIVVHSTDELRGSTWAGEKVFQVHFNSNLDAEQAGRLLDVVAGHLDGYRPE